MLKDIIAAFLISSSRFQRLLHYEIFQYNEKIYLNSLTISLLSLKISSTLSKVTS